MVICRPRWGDGVFGERPPLESPTPLQCFSPQVWTSDVGIYSLNSAVPSYEPQAPGLLFLRELRFFLKAWNGGGEGSGRCCLDTGSALLWRPGLGHLQAGSLAHLPAWSGTMLQPSFLFPVAVLLRRADYRCLKSAPWSLPSLSDDEVRSQRTLGCCRRWRAAHGNLFCPSPVVPGVSRPPCLFPLKLVDKEILL